MVLKWEYLRASPERISRTPRVTASNSNRPTAPLENALNQTQQVQERLNSGAQELFVVSEVLKQELPPEVRTGDVAQALEKHEALEEKVQECADDLQDVTRALAQEVAERKKLEKRLNQVEDAFRTDESLND